MIYPCLRQPLDAAVAVSAHESREKMNNVTPQHALVAANRVPGPWWKRLPVSINCAYGDPLIKQQEKDTAEKLRALAESFTSSYFCYRA